MSEIKYEIVKGLAVLFNPKANAHILSTLLLAGEDVKSAVMSTVGGSDGE